MTDPMSQLCWIFTTLMMLQLGLRTRRGGSELRSSERSRGYEEQHGEGATQGFPPESGAPWRRYAPEIADSDLEAAVKLQRRGGGDGGDSGGGDHAEGHGARRGFVRCVLRSDSFHDSIHAHNQEDAVFERPCKKKRGSVLLYVWGRRRIFCCAACSS